MSILCRLRQHDWRHVKQTYSYIMSDGPSRYADDGRQIYWEDEYACQRCHLHRWVIRVGHHAKKPYVPPT